MLLIVLFLECMFTPKLVWTKAQICLAAQTETAIKRNSVIYHVKNYLRYMLWYFLIYVMILKCGVLLILKLLMVLWHKVILVEHHYSVSSPLELLNIGADYQLSENRHPRQCYKMILDVTLRPHKVNIWIAQDVEMQNWCMSFKTFSDTFYYKHFKSLLDVER